MTSTHSNTATHLASLNSINFPVNVLPQKDSSKVGKQAASYNFGKLIHDTPFKKGETPREMNVQCALINKKTLDLNGEKIFDCDSWLINDFYATQSSAINFSCTEKILGN